MFVPVCMRIRGRRLLPIIGHVGELYPADRPANQERIRDSINLI